MFKLPNNKSDNTLLNQVVIESLQEKAKCLKPITLTWEGIAVYPPEKNVSLFSKIRKTNADLGEFESKPNKLIIDNGILNTLLIPINSF